MFQLKRILCPTDFSELSLDGLAKAVELAEEGVTEICVVHVEPPSEVLTPLAGIAPTASGPAQRRAAAVKNLRSVLEERVPPGVATCPILRQGDAGAEIVRVAREKAVDLIVLTTHGARGWRPGVLGAVAEAVLRTAPCPVLTLSGPATGWQDNHRLDAARNGAGAVDSLRPSLEVVSSHAIFLDGD